MIGVIAIVVVEVKVDGKCYANNSFPGFPYFLKLIFYCDVYLMFFL